jgi:4-aminobutyrate aminotransferase/(S)-3-amino-2-methylpropionate transaminase
VLGRAEILGGTFGGNRVSCAAVLKVLEKVERESLCARAADIGAQIRSRAERWREKFSLIGDIRAFGAMVGIEFVERRVSKEPIISGTVTITPKLHENVPTSKLALGVWGLW